MKTLFCICTLLLLHSPSYGKVLEKIHVVVNGEIITKTFISAYYDRLKNGGFINDYVFFSPEVVQQALSSRDYLIERLIEEKIIDYEVKKNGFVVGPDRIEKEISNIAKNKKLTPQQLRQVIKQQGIDFAEYQDYIKTSLERRQLVEKEVTSKIKVSEQDILAYYLSQNNTSSTQVYEYQLAHILLPKESQQLANSIAKEVVKKNNFPSLVKSHSVDEESKSNGGDFGIFKSGEMIPSIEAAISQLKMGETTNPVATPLGLHIFKLIDKKLVKDPAIEKQKEVIYRTLFAKAFKEQFAFWMSQKRKDAIIQNNDKTSKPPTKAT